MNPDGNHIWDIMPFSFCNTVSCIHKYRMIYFWLAVFGVFVPLDGLLPCFSSQAIKSSRLHSCRMSIISLRFSKSSEVHFFLCSCNASAFPFSYSNRSASIILSLPCFSSQAILSLANSGLKGASPFQFSNVKNSIISFLIRSSSDSLSSGKINSAAFFASVKHSGCSPFIQDFILSNASSYAFL